MITLHAYVLRELLKTFGLALAGLTILFTMGGGIFNVMHSEGVTTADLMRFLPLLIPIIITLTMPLAALFAATMVYGRLTADNELLACRAAGINVHRLFLSVMLLSLFVAAFTLVFGNFVIPDFMQRIERFARTNLRDFAAQRLIQQGFIRFRDEFFLTAEHVETRFSKADLEAKGFDPELSYMSIRAPTFLQIAKNGEIIRFTTAAWGMVEFDTRSTPITVTLHINDGRDYQPPKRIVSIQSQKIGPIQVPLPFKRRPSWADLPSLIAWRKAPWRADKLRLPINEFLVHVAIQRFYESTVHRIGSGRTVVLGDERGGRYEISAERAEQDAKRGGRVRLTNARVRMFRPDEPKPTRYFAGRVELIARPLGPGEDSKSDKILIEIRLLRTADQHVYEDNPRSADYGTPHRKGTMSIDGVSFPDGIFRGLQDVTPANVIDPCVPLALPEALEARRAGLQASAEKLRRKVAATIHFRLGLSASVLVTLLMGAALGVIFRGAAPLSAFGLAFVPVVIVVIFMVMGRQLGENPGSQTAGAIVTWGGLLALLLADVLLVRLGVRR